MTIQSIPLSKLEISPLNVRKTASKSADAELMASIIAHGLINPLTVIERGGKFQVVAGGRRLKALEALQKDGKLPKDHKVDCQLAANDDAAEVSLAENVVRQAMLPADEFEAFNALATAKPPMSTTEIAERFGRTEKLVLQRLKLARVAPQLLKEYRAGKINLECLEAFTITDDQKRQMHVYNSLQGWQRDNAGAIRGRLTQGELIASNKHVLFVGLDAYKKAGGTIREDLFGDATVINNRELVAKLVEDKLKAVITALEEQGWGWVRYDEQQDYQFTSYCGRIHPDEKSAPADLLSKQQKLEKQLEKLEQAEIDEDDEDANSANDQKQEELREQIEAVEEEIASKLAYKPAQMKTAGCYVTIDSHGKLKVLRGLVKPSDKRKVESDEGKKSSAKPTKTASGISQALLDSLKAFRLQVAEVAIASTPDLAYDLYTYTTAMSLLAKQSSYQQSLDIILHDKTPIFGEVKGTDAQKRLAELKGQLELGWTSRKTEAEKFDAFRELSAKEKADILAYCVALMLKPSWAPSKASDITAADLVLADADDFCVADYWRPTQGNYLGRVPTDQLLALGKAIHGDDWHHKSKAKKKAALAINLEADFRDPKASAAVKAWLPEGMEFTLPEAKADQSKKPAKSRKAA